jgi:hypothetical protein
MRKLSIVLSVLVLCLGFTGVMMAADSSNQTVNTTVSAVNEVAATGTITLSVSTATAGSDLDADTDTDTADLAWTTNQSGKKISAKLSSALTSGSLSVQAVSITGSGTPGTAQSAITLTESDQDLITVITTTAASCDLTYSLSANAADGSASQVENTVVFTITTAS